MNEDKFEKLRQKAQEVLLQNGSEKSVNYINEVEKLIEELNIFQIELEMQNNELQLTNKKLIAEQEKYYDLYKNAPVAYFTINETGNIYDLNNIAAEMLYLPIHAINKTSIFPYLEANSKTIFNQFFKTVFNSLNVEQTEINFIDSNNQIVNTKINAQSYFDYKHKKKLCRCAVTDITRQKKYEKIITDQNELLKLAFDNEKVAWWDWDYATGNVRFSPNKATMLGYKLDEFPTNVYKITELIHPDDYNEAMEAMSNHLRGITKFYEVTYRIKSKQGSYEYYFDYGKVIERDSNGKPSRINGIVFNISQQKKFEVDLKKTIEIAEVNQQRFKNLFNFNYDGVRIVDTNGIIIDVNQRMCDITGYTCENIIGKYIWDVIYRQTPTYKKTPEIFQRIKEICIIALETGVFPFANLQNEQELQCADGSIKIVETNYFAVSVKNGFLLYSVIHDITNFRKNQNELISAKEKVEESEQRFKSLIENAQDGVVILDLQGKFTYASPNAARQFGYTENEILGRSGDEFTNPEDLPLVLQIFEKIMFNPALKPKLKYRFKRKNGEYRWIETTFTNLLQDKAINGIVLNFIDITERKKIEIELLSSKELFKAIFEQAAAGIAIALPNGKIVNSNPKFAEMLGYSIDELLSLTTFDITFPDDIQKEISLVDQVLEKKLETFYIEKRYTHKKGHIVWTYLSSNVVKDENGNIIFVIGVAIDISERKAIENELIIAKEKAEESEERIQSVFSVAPTGIGLVKDRIICEVNPKICEMTGYSSEELIGKSSLILYSFQNEFDLVGKLKYNQINEKGTGIVETKWKRKNGTIIDILLASTPLDMSDYKKGITFTALDISERKAIENELIIAKEKAEESEEKYKQIFDNTFDIMSIYEVTEDHRFKVITFNPAEEKLIGSLENYQNKYIDECIPPELYFQFKQNYERCIKEEKLIEYEEYISFEHINKTFNTQLIPLKNSEGRIHRIIVISRDITENKQLNSQLTNQNKKLKLLNYDLTIAKEKAEESDRLKSSFLQNMSHEVRTPLNAIQGFSQLMSNPKLSPEKFKKFSEIIAENSDKLISIITDVIEISQIQSKLVKAKLIEFDIVLFLNETVYSFKAKEKEKNIELQIKMNIQFHEYFIQSDKEKLQRILIHLIDNAIKFTIQGYVKIVCELENENIKFTIADTGIGISEEMQKIIFEPFRQVETGICRNFGGNGLGLSLSKSYIELLNGSITLESEINKGSVFTVTIPTNKNNIQAIKTHETNKINVNTLLIVEDEYYNYQYLLALLEDKDYKILYAENGQKAIDLCRANSKIDLILMDIKMPVMDGHTAAKLIKDFRPNMIIIAQTAFALESEKETFIGIFDDYITKPINEEILNQKLLKYIE